MTKRYKQQAQPAPQLAEPDATQAQLKAPIAVQNTIGRPRKVLTDQEQRQRVLDLIAQGYTLTELATLPGLPSIKALQGVMGRDSAFREAVSRARSLGAHFLAERGLAIVDGVDVTSDTVRADLYKAKLRCDARFKLAAAWAPSEFGTKHSSVVVNQSPVTLALDPAQLRVLARLAMGALNQSVVVDAAPLQLATPKER